MTQTAAPSPGGRAGFEPARNTGKMILWIAVAMLAVLAALLGVLYFLYRQGPPTADPALDTVEESPFPDAPPAPIEPQP